MAALSLRFGLVLGGCLEDAAAAFDEIFASLLPTEARDLEQLLQDIDNTLDGPTVEPASSDEAKPSGAWLHRGAVQLRMPTHATLKVPRKRPAPTDWCIRLAAPIDLSIDQLDARLSRNLLWKVLGPFLTHS